MQKFDELVEIVARLRADDGCPWDREQTHLSVAGNITEEAAEAVDAIERGDLIDLREELGDLLLQVLLQAQIASEANEFTLTEVVGGIAEKLVRRHPHVFGIEAALEALALSAKARADFEDKIAAAENAEAVLELWDNIKLLEREQKLLVKRAAATAGAAAPTAAASAASAAAPAGAAAAAGAAVETPTPGDSSSLLDSVPAALPALMQAQAISRKAISVGFDWGGVEEVWQQVSAETEEFRQEDPGSDAASDEFGDILFSLVNVALKEGIDAESALRSTIRRFRSRWSAMEQYAQQDGCALNDCTQTRLETYWQRAKQQLAAKTTP